MTATNPKAEERRLRAVEFKKNGQFDKALEEYGKAIEIQRDYARVYYNRAILYYEMKEYDKAIADYSQAIRLLPKGQEPQEGCYYANRAACYNDTEQYDLAIADLTKALELNPKNAGYWFSRGIALGGKGKHYEAIADFNKTIRLDPHDASAYYNRGIAHSHAADHRAAITDWETALKIEPDIPCAGQAKEYLLQAHKRLAFYLYSNGNLLRAAEHWEKMLQLDPNNQEIRDMLKLLNKKENKIMVFCMECGTKLPEGAKFCMSCGTAVGTAATAPAPANPSPVPHQPPEKLMQEAQKLLDSGSGPGEPYSKKIADAIAAYTDIIAQDESYPHVWTMRGYAKLLGVEYFDAEYLFFETYDEALADLNRAIEEDEEDGNAYIYRAQIHWKCGRIDDALEDIKQGFYLPAEDWGYTATEMYKDGVELPEEIIDALRDSGYIDEEEDEDEE